MKNEDIIRKLKEAGKRNSAVELARLLKELRGGTLDASIMISYFFQAFPEIPLQVLIESQTWNGVCTAESARDDETFNEFLSKWLPTDK